MTEHKHAEFLRALADGVPLEAFIATRDTWLAEDSPKDHNISDIYMLPERWQVRRKPKTIDINGFAVPEPVREPLTLEQGYFMPNIHTHTMPCEYMWGGGVFDTHALKSGMIHLNKEAAVTHGRALRSFTEVE